MISLIILPSPSGTGFEFANVLVDSAGMMGGGYQPVYPQQQARPTQFFLDEDPQPPVIRSQPQFVNPGQDVQVGVRKRRVQKSNDIDISLSLLSDREEDLDMFRSKPSSQGVKVIAPKQSQSAASGVQNFQFPLDDDVPPPVVRSQPQIRRDQPQFVNPGQEVTVGVRKRRVQKSQDIDISLDLLSDREEDLNMFRSKPAPQGVKIIPLNQSHQPGSQGVKILSSIPSQHPLSGPKTLDFNLETDSGSEIFLNTPVAPPTQVYQTSVAAAQGRTAVGPIPLNFDEINFAPSVDRQPHQFNLDSEGSDVEPDSKISSRPMEISLDSEDESYGTPVELDLNRTISSDEFEYIQSGANGIFTPRDGFYFKSVSENNVPLWKGEKDEYAKKVVRDGIGKFKSLNHVFIYMTNGVVREFNKESGMWNQMPVRTDFDDGGNQIHATSKPRKKVAVVDHGDIYVQDARAEPYESEEEEEVNDRKYDDISGVDLNLGNKYSTTSYNCEKESHKTTFTANDGYGFRAVLNYRDKSSLFTIWTAKNSSHYAYKVVYHEYPFKISDVVVYLFNGKGSLLATIGDNWMEFNLKKIHPVVVNIDYPFDTYTHSSDSDGSCAVITPNAPFAINELVEFHGFKNKTREVWRAKSAKDYPVKVVVDNREFMVVFEDQDLYKNASNINLYFKDGRILYLTRVKGTNWVERTTNKMELDIGLLKDTIFHSLDWDLTCVTYEKRNDFLITRVKHSIGISPFKRAVNIWTAKNPGEYVNKVVVDGYYHIIDCFKPYNAILFLENGIIKHMSYSNYRWVDIEPSCILDITKRESTFEYYYKKEENNIEHFDPKYQFLFNGVNYSVGSGTSTVQVEIWDAADPKEYAFKVCLVKTGKNEKFVVIFQVNGQVKIFNKCDKSRPWADHSTNRYSINDIRIAGLDIVAFKIERERAKLEEAEKLKLEEAEKLKLDESSPNAFQPFDRSQYKPAHTISERLTYSKPQSQGLIPPSASPQVKPKPEPVEEDGNNLLHLDIQKRHNIFGYTISYRDGKVIFKAVEPFLFGIVTSDGTTLWRYKGDEYPNRVLYKEVNGKPKVKVYFPDYLPPRFVMRAPSNKFDPSSIPVEVSKCRKPGSEFIKAKVVEVSGTPVNTNPEDPEDLYVAPKEPRKKQWVVDDD